MVAKRTASGATAFSLFGLKSLTDHAVLAQPAFDILQFMMGAGHDTNRSGGYLRVERFPNPPDDGDRLVGGRRAVGAGGRLAVGQRLVVALVVGAAIEIVHGAPFQQRHRRIANFLGGPVVDPQFAGGPRMSMPHFDSTTLFRL